MGPTKWMTTQHNLNNGSQALPKDFLFCPRDNLVNSEHLSSKISLFIHSVSLETTFLEFPWSTGKEETNIGAPNFSNVSTKISSKSWRANAGVGPYLYRDFVCVLYNSCCHSFHPDFSYAGQTPWISNLPCHRQQSGTSQLCSQLLHLLLVQCRD